MTFREAIRAIYDGKKVCLPEWYGWWYLGNDNLIWIHTKDNEELPTPWFGQYCQRDDWSIFGE